MYARLDAVRVGFISVLESFFFGSCDRLTYRMWETSPQLDGILPVF